MRVPGTELACRREAVIEVAARAAHEANRAFCIFHGEDAIADPWTETTEEIRQSARDGVIHALENPDATPEDSHINWCKFKRAEGWVYGEKKDFGAKTHHCLVPYEELPRGQRFKDSLFQAVVKSVLAQSGFA